MKIQTVVSSLLLCALLSSSAFAIDKAAIVEHVRETYSFPPGLDVSLSDPKPSEIPGFDVMDLKISRGTNQQVEKLYISRSGRYYVLGGFKDLQYSPDKERLSKMQLANAPIRGNKQAPVTVVEYTDFQCPFCQVGYQVMRQQIMKEYPDKVRWVYKSLPLKSIHPWAETAAIGAECAHLQGEDKFWTMHDTLFDHQKEITVRNINDKVVDFAKAAGLAPQKFAACFKGRESLNVVNKDLKEAEDLNIPGTPAFVINGRLIPSADYDSIKQSIEEALKKHAA